MNDNELLANATDAVKTQFPVLEPHLKNSVVSYGTSTGPNDDRQLEFYHPWDEANPNPGKNTIEIFNRDLKGNDLHAAIAGDLLHRLGSIEPSTGLPVDPKFYQMRRELSIARDPIHRRMDREAYEMEKSSPFHPGEYPEWDQRSRIDAYVRAGIFPEQNPQWNESITPELKPIFDRMKTYLKTGLKLTPVDHNPFQIKSKQNSILDVEGSRIAPDGNHYVKNEQGGYSRVEMQ